MAFLSNFPRLRKGSLVVLDPASNKILDTIYFQFNPERLTRTLQIQASGKEGGDRTEALRLKGAPIETIKLDAEFDTTGPLPQTEQVEALQAGIYPQLSALETLLYPTSQSVKVNMQQAAQGVLEIIPPQAPMTLLIWGTQRVLPVRLADFSITEEAYDVNLNPIRAKVSLSLRVLNYDDLPWNQRESNLFLAHHQAKENLAKRRGAGYSSEATGVAANQFLI
jgi:Contractile injection system tube protein